MPTFTRINMQLRAISTQESPIRYIGGFYLEFFSFPFDGAGGGGGGGGALFRDERALKNK